MNKEYDLEALVKEYDPKLTQMKEEFLNGMASCMEEDYDSMGELAEDYFDDVADYLDERLPILIDEGRVDAAWNTVLQAYGGIGDDDLEEYDENEAHELCLSYLMQVAEAVKSHEEKDDLLTCLISIEGNEDFPSWVRSASGVVVHDAFTEARSLRVIAEWYKEKYSRDPEMMGAFWKGKLRDIAERLDNDQALLADLEKMDECDPVMADLVYAECLSRRGDKRCLAVWESVEKEIDEDDEDHLLYGILWARLDYYSSYGTEEEAEAAEEALNEYIGVMDDDCCCGDDDCGCGHHHDDEEEHECHCGHHHDHEEGHECHCGHHHDN